MCVCCGNSLFASDIKFNSGTGWPIFWTPINEGSVKEERDKNYGMIRTEIICVKCGAHLRHVFDGGPEPTGLCYCINSLNLSLEKDRH